ARAQPSLGEARVPNRRAPERRAAESTLGSPLNRTLAIHLIVAVRPARLRIPDAQFQNVAQAAVTKQWSEPGAARLIVEVPRDDDEVPFRSYAPTSGRRGRLGLSGGRRSRPGSRSTAALSFFLLCFGELAGDSCTSCDNCVPSDPPSSLRRP